MAKSASGASNVWRINLFAIIVMVVMGLIVYRLFNLTFVQHSAFVQSAKSQYNNPSALLAGRGNIYFSDLASDNRKIGVTNRSSFYLYTNNQKISSAGEIASKLAPILNIQQSDLETQLSQEDKTYLVIAQGLSKDQADKINGLKIAGVTAASEITRFYAFESLAASVLGFVGFDNGRRAGQYGVESYYDDVLSGDSRTQSFFGNKTYSSFLNIFKFGKDEEPETTMQQSEEQTGSDILLTIDHNIQSLIEVKLKELLNKWDAESGSIIIQDPTTGAILAMTSSPSFDPNNYSDYGLSSFINPNVQEVFEPGSSFKPITMAAAVDAGAVTPDTTYDDTGAVKIGGYTIRNFNEKANGIQTMREVLQKSLNTGAIYAQRSAGDDTFLNYVVSFGFGQKSGADLSGEVSGNISNLFSGRDINFATASFGQGIAVTPLQLINAYSAIANGGKLMRPYVVDGIIRPDGSRTKTEPEIIGSPISEKTATQMKSMLIDVVDKGFDKARIKGYDVAGKTGTAQIPDAAGGYLENDQFIHDFVGFAPAYSPRFVILIKIDKPQGIRFASDSLSPAFGDIARFLIRYFNIPPTR
ncbi:MAG: penicillin-binding protein 2 [Candidatus Paceibacterota bacterium]